MCVCVLCLFMIINIVYGCSHCCRLYCNNHTVLKIWLFSMNNLLHWAHLTANDCMYYGALLKSKYNKSKTFSYQSISTQNQCCFEAGWMMPWLFLYKAGRFFFFWCESYDSLNESFLPSVFSQQWISNFSLLSKFFVVINKMKWK